MKLKKHQNINSNNNLNLKNIEPKFLSLNSTFVNSHTVNNSQKNSIKKIISFSTLTNLNKFSKNTINNKNKTNNDIIYRKNNNLTAAEKQLQNISKYKFKKTKLLLNKNKNFNSKNSSSYSHFLNKKDQYNNNSLNIIRFNNLKERFYPIKEKNKLNNIIDIKKNSYSLKNQYSFWNNKIKIHENNNDMLSKSGGCELIDIESGGRNLTEDNNEIKKYNTNKISNIFLNNNNIKNHKQIKIIRKNNLNFYEDENDYISENKDNLTKDEISLHIKKYNLLLEENQLYKKKFFLSLKENKKLKEIIKNKNKEKINEVNKLKLINKELKNENEYLKNEINDLKNKMNKILALNNKNKIQIKEKNDMNSLNCANSFGNNIPGIIMPTTERYIKKLEKENEELSNRISKYNEFFQV